MVPATLSDPLLETLFNRLNGDLDAGSLADALPGDVTLTLALETLHRGRVDVDLDVSDPATATPALRALGFLSDVTAPAQAREDGTSTLTGSLPLSALGVLEGVPGLLGLTHHQTQGSAPGDTPVTAGDEGPVIYLPNGNPVAVPVEFADYGFGGPAHAQLMSLSLRNGSDLDDRLSSAPTSGDMILNGFGGHDRLTGASGDDLLSGGADGDSLRGRKGDDVLLGGTGNDVLKGGKGADLLDGGAGNDWLRGGKDADVFRLSAGRDIIQDFTPGEDTLDISVFAPGLGAAAFLSDIVQIGTWLLWQDGLGNQLAIEGLNRWELNTADITSSHPGDAPFALPMADAVPDEPAPTLESFQPLLDVSLDGLMLEPGLLSGAFDEGFLFAF